MPLGVREVLLVIRAQDAASRVVSEVGLSLGALGSEGENLGRRLSAVGAGLTAIGAGMIGIGALGLSFIKQSVDTFVDYDTAARKTLTQVSGFKASLAEVKQVALDVAAAVPVPFEELQPALFDIFSSIPVANMTQAKDILLEMSKAAVAGATDIQTVAQSNFEIINAFGLGVGDLNNLLDIQFKLVQLGIGDYADINTGIGRLAPTAKTAGQTIDTMAGSLAFMTRITGDGSQAITAIQRAMESITNPKVAAKFSELGIKVADASGNFRPFKDIVDDLSGALSKMDPQNRAATIFDIFKGSGSGSKNTRQFFMAAIDNIDQFNSILDQVGDHTGAMENAFDIMRDGSPAAAVEQLSNNWKIFQESIGGSVIPILVSLLGYVQQGVTWLNGLSDGQKDLIAKFILFGSVAAIVGGAVLALLGILAVFAGVLLTAGVSVGGVIAIMAGIPLVIGLIIAGVVLMIQHWDELGPKVQEVWANIQIVVGQVSDWLQQRWAELRDTLTKTWEDVKGRIANTLTEIRQLFDTVITSLENWWNVRGKALWSKISTDLQQIWNDILATIGPVVKLIINVIGAFATEFTFIWDAIGQNVINIVGDFVGIVVDLITEIVGIVTGVVQVVSDLINGDWGKAWDAAKTVVADTFNGIVDLSTGFMDLIGNVIEGIVNIIIAPFQWLYDELLGHSIIPDMINGIVDWFSRLPSMLLGAIGNAIGWLVQTGRDIVQGMWNGITAVFNDLLGWFSGLGSRIFHWLGDMSGVLWDTGITIMNGLKNGLEAGWHAVTGFLSDLNPANWKGPPARDALMLVKNGELIMAGLQAGMQSGWDDTTKWLQSLNPNVSFNAGALGADSYGNALSGGRSVILQIAPGAIIVNGVSDPKESADHMLTGLEELIRELNTGASK